MKILEGMLTGRDKKFAIVVSRFNDFITSKLVDGAYDCLIRHEVSDDDITLVKVPGAFEIPLATQKLAESGAYDGIICLGAVIRGATSHYDYVCNEVSKGIAKISLDTNLPVGFGIVTTENIEQAIERAGTKSGNKGYDTAMSVLEMVDLFEAMA